MTPAAAATRVVATATAVVALTGAGAGLASAHDGDGYTPGDDDATGSDTSSRMIVDRDGDYSASSASSPACDAGDLSTAGLDSTCLTDVLDQRSDPGYDGASTGGAGADTAPSVQPAAATAPRRTAPRTAPRPAAPAAPAVSSNPIDTPPPSGQTRMIKLPSSG